jgi:hypothetical protein
MKEFINIDPQNCRRQLYLCIYKQTTRNIKTFPSKPYKINYNTSFFSLILWLGMRVRTVGFNATFNHISVISWRSVLLVEETGENHRPVASH